MDSLILDINAVDDDEDDDYEDAWNLWRPKGGGQVIADYGHPAKPETMFVSILPFRVVDVYKLSSHDIRYYIAGFR